MKIRDYYDRAAAERTPNYQRSSRWIDALVHRPNERFVRRIVQHRLRDAGSVADLGCGNGEHLLAPLPKLRRLFLNDLSPTMLEQAAEGLARAHPGVEIASFCGPIDSIPRDTPPCDVALCLGVVNHLEGRPLDDTLAALARLASRSLLLYYAHEGFLLSSRVGISFRRRDIHYRALDRDAVARTLRREGFEPAAAHYAFKLALLSPLVVQEFETAGHP